MQDNVDIIANSLSQPLFAVDNYILNEHGLLFAKQVFEKYGIKLKKVTTIDNVITHKLLEFINGQPTTRGNSLEVPCNLLKKKQ